MKVLIVSLVNILAITAYFIVLESRNNRLWNELEQANESIANLQPFVEELNRYHIYRDSLEEDWVNTQPTKQQQISLIDSWFSWFNELPKTISLSRFQVTPKEIFVSGFSSSPNERDQWLASKNLTLVLKKKTYFEARGQP